MYSLRVHNCLTNDASMNVAYTIVMWYEDNMLFTHTEQLTVP